MHTKILHHLFRIVSEDAIRAPLWDVEALGPAAFPNNAAYVHQQVSQLLTTSFSNLRPQQVEVSTCPLRGNPKMQGSVPLIKSFICLIASQALLRSHVLVMTTAIFWLAYLCLA